MKFLVMFFTALTLIGCQTVDPAHQRTYDKSAEYRRLVDQGKMKRSEMIRKSIEDVINTPRIGPQKAETIRLLHLTYKNEKAFEEGKITQEKYDEIWVEIQARMAEIEQKTNQWVSQRNRQRAQAWGQALKNYNDYLDRMQPKQPWQVTCETFAGTTTCTRD